MRAYDDVRQGREGRQRVGYLRDGGPGCRGGATMALNLNNPKWGTATDKDSQALQRARDEQGWGIFAVPVTWEDLLVFARAFSRETFA